MNYDNAGLLTGRPDIEIEGVLVSLDCTEDIIDEAVRKDCNVGLSSSYHFQGFEAIDRRQLRGTHGHKGHQTGRMHNGLAHKPG